MNQPSDSWSDNDWATFEEWLRSMLRETAVTVTFTKSDGTERVMRCTLQPEYLPKQSLTESKQRKSSETSIPVWDLDVGGWRSFTLRRVRSVAFQLGEQHE